MTHPATTLDELVHQRTRLGILAVLRASGAVDFAVLKEELGLTDGNLARHLQTLERGRLVATEKVPDGRRTRTRVTLTREGSAALDTEVRTLRAILDSLVTTARQPAGEPDALALSAPGAHIARR